MTLSDLMMKSAVSAALASLFLLNPAPLAAQADCAATVARFREAVAFDIKQGQLGDQVGKTMEAEIGKADAACRSGQSRQGLAIIARLKKQYGYAN